MKIPSIPPQNTPPLDNRGGDTSLPPLLSNAWWLPLNQLFLAVGQIDQAVTAITPGPNPGDTGVRPNSIIIGTRAGRASFLPASRPNSIYEESDTTLIYFSDGSSWAYRGGTYSRTQAQLSAFIATLTASDVGMRIYVSDYAHVLWCTAAATTAWAPEDTQDAGQICFFDVAPGTGWGLLDGSGNIAILKSDGTTRNNANAADHRASVHVRGANAYNGAVTAASAPTISGSTATGTASLGTPTVPQIVQSGTGVTVAASNHTHIDGGHTHGAGTLATSLAGGDPVATTDALPYIRR